jgi:cytoskeletal protein CcmA (bactofilin family)
MATATKAEAMSATTIGPTIIIKGRLKVDEDLTVQGRIDAEITSSKALIIENSGIVKANVRVRSAKISGVLVGNITAEEKIEIAPDGRVVGDLQAPRIVISDGAAFRGRIEMQGFESEATALPTAAMVLVPATAPAPLPIPLPDAVTGSQSARPAPKPAGKH